MQLPRSSRKSAALIVAGLIPVGGLLIGSTAGAGDHLADPAPARVAHAEPAAAAKPQAPAIPTVTETVRPAAVRLPVSVMSGMVPKINYEAYLSAAETMAKKQPLCGIDWRLIAGIGRVESHHANSGDADARGQLRTPIFGPVLDGSLAGNQVITDTDGGRLDGDPVHDRAVGPMQFLPSTWEHYGADADGDGTADPQNIFDAALTTARYLCDDGMDLRNPNDVTRAVLRYNNSMTYVDDVVGYARSY